MNFNPASRVFLLQRLQFVLRNGRSGKQTGRLFEIISLVALFQMLGLSSQVGDLGDQARDALLG